ncbi:hypothetical protein [Cohnella silvisoli]|uniref:hypothetical protein n=1 Tax=Cohnella silvisoli TaxID=2873699 RepID=UPI0035A01EF9
MHEQTPIMYVFAGNNGSGKSTIRNLIVDRLGISVNIEYLRARKLSDWLEIAFVTDEIFRLKLH